MASEQRNIAVIAHIDAGKTTLTEQLLFWTGATMFAGSVDDGSTMTDWKRQEQERGITIGSAAVSVSHRDIDITVVDTPGHVDFTIEVERSLRVIEGGVVVFNGPEGIQAQTETVWRQAERHALPLIGFVNKIDRPGFDDFAFQSQVRERFELEPLPLQVPILDDEERIVLLDVLKGDVVVWEEPHRHAPARIGTRRLPTPDEDVEISVARERIIEWLADDDAHIADYVLSDASVPNAELVEAINRAVKARRCLPLLYGVGRSGIGVCYLADAIVDLLPAPSRTPHQKLYDVETGDELQHHPSNDDDQALGFVFKTERRGTGEILSFIRVFSGVFNSDDALVRASKNQPIDDCRLVKIMGGGEEEVTSLAEGTIGGIVSAGSLFVSGDTVSLSPLPWMLEPILSPHPVVDRVLEALDSEGDALVRHAARDLEYQDPSLRVSSDPVTGQLVLSGVGELQLELALQQLNDMTGVTIRAGQPRVHHYRIPAEDALGRGEIEDPLTGLTLRAEVRLEAGLTPPETIVRIEPGLRLTGPQNNAATGGLERALLRVGDPSADCVGLGLVLSQLTAVRADTSLAAVNRVVFDAATDAIVSSNPRLSESWVRVAISVPPTLVGGVVADLERRRAKILGTETRGRMQTCIARGPLSQFLNYSTDIRSLTGGQALFTLEPCGIDLSLVWENR